MVGARLASTRPDDRDGFIERDRCRNGIAIL
jgi:hypothetical protein